VSACLESSSLGAAGPGLVSPSTSHEPSQGAACSAPLEVDSLESRMRRMVKAVRGTAALIVKHFQDRGVRYRSALVTLTYAPGQAWTPRDISGLTQHYRDWARSRGIPLAGVWVLELQRRGAPHYHLLLFLPRGYTPPKPDRQGWWRKGSSNCIWARSPVGYVAKYASKSKQKSGEGVAIPKGARMHGHIGLPALVQAARSWMLAPGWLREIAPQGTRIVRRGPWWRSLALGIEWRSPWTLDGFSPPPAGFGAWTIRLRWVGFTEASVRWVA